MWMFSFLITMSPAKRFQAVQPPCAVAPSKPIFLAQADQIALKLKMLSSAQLAKMMRLSTSLAQLNYDRYQNYAIENPENRFLAAYLFAGDAFRALDFSSLSPSDIYAHKTTYLFCLASMVYSGHLMKYSPTDLKWAAIHKHT